jgi:hypothetical protein
LCTTLVPHSKTVEKIGSLETPVSATSSSHPQYAEDVTGE